MRGKQADVVVVGGGHNGLVCATLLARAGLATVLCEASNVLGGACRTEYPFPRVPGLGQSTGAYLLGLMPPELTRLLDLDLPLLRRNPHYVLPRLGGPALVLGADPAANALALGDDAAADARLQAELAALRDDLAPAWLAEPVDLDATAERYIRANLRDTFAALVRGSAVDYLSRFGFSERVLAMYVVTDALSGVNAGPDSAGTGHNFLVHNMCRLPGAGGTWQVVRGGMGTVTAALADRARAAGAALRVEAPVAWVTTSGGVVSGVAFPDGSSIAAPVVVHAGDPFRLPGLLGSALPAALGARLDRVRRTGTTMKVNLALRALPPLLGVPDDVQPWGATVHLLPDEPSPLAALRAMWADVEAGRLPEFPTIEWYAHTSLDPSLQDPAGHHSSALFVQSVPYTPINGSWDDLCDAYVSRLLDICERFAPGTRAAVADVFALPPPRVESHFGITGGHIHHVDNTYAFTDRIPYALGIDGLYACGAGCHPAGSVVGAAGHNAAQRILHDLDRV